ncbi:hypothetical protein JR316_0010871 [Psilocybe cubensis]|uniref:Uncharacterized protein n=1 Tax=Psilocybe cubensis TaxID=181762 RepID=A0ACB8GNB0_PSICU|nr:hypothetical protein JR316_0010871 [Psilocybe cubensis]KAH9476955.1 hypothetical protein JR316_0010871 [Psilocybe cubensis]
MRLPASYRQTGVCIGDVGIITPEGAFDCLFNICLPRDYSVNSHVPENFVPFGEADPDSAHSLSQHRYPILEYRSFSSGAYLASDNIHANQAHPNNGMHFIASAPEGAILTMPRGAHLQRLANPHQFDGYIAANAESWYKFVNTTLRRGAENGDLRIVTGCHKSSAWGMAAVFHSSQHEAIQSHSTLRFNAIPPTQSRSGNHLYFWEVTGSVLAKVGPDTGDNDGLFDGQHSHEIRNQCLFVTTHSVSIRPEVWAKLTPGSSVYGGGETSGSSLSVHNTMPATDQNRRWPSRFWGQNFRMRTRGNDTVVMIQSDSGEPSDIIPDHTKAINDILLQQDPNIRVAITNDSDWLDVLGKDDPSLVEPSELYSRIIRINDIQIRHDGLVHFELKNTSPDKYRSLCFEDDADTILQALEQGKRALDRILLTHFSDLRQLPKILTTAYVSNKGIDVPEISSPFLMEHPDALFTFEKLIESLYSEEPDSIPLLPERSTRSELYQTLSSSQLPNSSRQRCLTTLANATWNCYLQFGRPQHLDDAIWLYEQAINLAPITSPRGLIPLFGVCSTLYRRFYLHRNLGDLVNLARYMQRQNTSEMEEVINRLASQAAAATTSHQPNHVVQQARWNNDYGADQNITGNYGARNYSISLFSRIKKRLNKLSQISTSQIVTINPQPFEANNLNSPINYQTRDLQVLATKWIQDKETATSILWFYGPYATTMVKGLVERPSIESDIASTFDFSDTAAWSNEVYDLFPTIAVDLAFKISGLLEFYMTVPSNKDQEITDSSLSMQFWGLIINPLLRHWPKQNIHQFPTTIIINGIDKCGYKVARHVINLITEAVVTFGLPLRFLITSNKNRRLQDVFDGPLLSKVSRQFFVGSQAPNMDAVNSPSSLLKSASVKLPSDIFDTVVERSRGLSVYAETILRFIKASGEGNPMARLTYLLENDMALRHPEELTSPFAALDNLFIKILSTHSNRKELINALGILLVLDNCDHPETISQDIFGLLPMTGFFSSVLNVLQPLMQLPKVSNSNEPHVHPWFAVKMKVPSKYERELKNPYLALPFLSLSTAITTAYTVPLAFRDRVHDSFYDFLVNPERSGPFHIDISHFHGQVAVAGFAFITHQLWRRCFAPGQADMPEASTFSPETLDYLKNHLPAHCAQCSESFRKKIIEHTQNAIESALNNEKEKAHSEGASVVEDFVTKISVLITKHKEDLMINDWDSSVEWCHYTRPHEKLRRTSKSRRKFSSTEHLYPTDEGYSPTDERPDSTSIYEDFYRLMDTFNDTVMVSKRPRKLRRLRKLKWQTRFSGGNFALEEFTNTEGTEARFT